MNTQEFLSAVLPNEGVCLVVTKQGDRKWDHVGFTDFEKAAMYAEASDAKGLETYFACASYKRPPYKNDKGETIARRNENWLKAKAFWVDIDCGADKAKDNQGYATQTDGFNALKAWCAKSGMPMPSIVNSGNGVHAYWIMTEPIEAKSWVYHASILKQAFANDGFLADPARTADFASILRPVGTHNRKDPKNPKPVIGKLLPATETSKLLDIIQSLVSDDERPEYLHEGLSESETIKVEYAETPCSAITCADKCKQMALMRDTKGDVHYDHWRGVIGVIKFCKEGFPIAEEWSSKRAETGHKQLDTDVRFNTWSSGPTTCEFFDKANPGVCKDCPFRNKIKTPLVLGRELPEQPTEITVDQLDVESGETTTTQYAIPTLPSGYTWNGSTLSHMEKNELDVYEHHPFCSTLFYLFERIKNADGKFEFGVRAHLPQGIVREFRILGSDIGSGGTALFSTLGENEILYSTGKTTAYHMQSYIRDSVKSLMSTASIKNTYSSFGWQENGGFLIGSRLYTPDGKTTEVLLSDAAAYQREAFPKPKGSVEEYAKQINWIYNRDGMEPMQYVICSLWAAPLVEFSDVTYNGIPVAVTSTESGKGKTTAAWCAIYAFGKATPDLTIAGKIGTTTKGQAKFLGVLRNLPILFDEVTNKTSQQLSDICFALSNGVEPIRLRPTGGDVTFGDRQYWRTHSAMTGNADICATLSLNGNSEAESVRVFEIHADEYDIPKLDPLIVSQAVSEISKNIGCAGEVYLKYLVENRSKVLEMLRESLEEIGVNKMLVSQPKYRFFRNHMATTITAAKIMKSLGVIDFDIDKLTAFAVDAVKRIFTRVQESLLGDDPMATLSAMLTEMSPKIITTASMFRPSDSPTADVAPWQFVCPQGLVGRSFKGTKAAHDEYNGRLYLSCTAVSDWCTEHRVNKRAWAEALKKEKVLFDTAARITLGRGTNIASSQQRCWALDNTKIEGMEETTNEDSDEL